jgi:hypothetical protein
LIPVGVVPQVILHV